MGELIVGIQTFTELLSVLESENKVFLKGQLIWAIDDISGSNKKGLKVGDFDDQTMLPGGGTPFHDLDWVIKPENAGANGFTPFPIEKADPQFNDDGTDTVITDNRLLEVTTALVYATDRGTYFKKSEQVIDPVSGTITLSGYTGMGANDQLLVFIPAAIVVSAELTALRTELDALKVFAAPFLDGGGKVLWNKPRNTIPAGWREWTGIRGRIPIAQDPTDLTNPSIPYDPVTNPSINGFGRPLGSLGGSVDHTISGTNFLPKFRLFTVVNQQLVTGAFPSGVGRAVSNLKSMILEYLKGSSGRESYVLAGSDADNVEPNISPTSWVGQDAPDAINHLNPYQLVHYIERDI